MNQIKIRPLLKLHGLSIYFPHPPEHSTVILRSYNISTHIPNKTNSARHNVTTFQDNTVKATKLQNLTHLLKTVDYYEYKSSYITFYVPPSKFTVFNLFLHFKLLLFYKKKLNKHIESYD